MLVGNPENCARRFRRYADSVDPEVPRNNPSKFRRKGAKVMNTYEHAYQLDYGAAASKYLDSFFCGTQWDPLAKQFN